jgi:hypothetical protein
MSSVPLSFKPSIAATTRNISTPSAKPFYVSGTFWMNAVTFLIVAINEAMQGGFVPDSWSPYLVFVVAILNAIARFFVERPLVPKL